MAANRFVLVPEDIYKGLTSTDTGNINLDYSKRMLENVKGEKTNPTIKNARYNQELRRYLHLRKEHEDKPVKVEITGVPESKTIETTQRASQKQKTSNRTPFVNVSPMVELSNEFLMKMNANPDKYNVTSEGRIKNEHGRIIEGSDMKKSINWIISNEKGLRTGPRPKGTIILENVIRRDDVLLQILQNLKTKDESLSFHSPAGTSTPKSKFTPSKWS